MEQTDNRPYGEELARQVGSCLFRGLALVDVHRDYCGVGLFHDDQGAFAAEVDDGLAGHGFARWHSLNAFVTFFAAQNDRSMDRSPGSAPGFETEDAWRHGNQTLTRRRLEAFVAEAGSGNAKRSCDYIDKGPPATLVLEEVLDHTALLRFLRDEMGYALKEAHDMLKDLPVQIFGISNAASGEQWIKRFADAGGRCAIHPKPL